ncbi:MAG: histidine phosphatase family protein [Candidatus Aenigmatarchaeota archaeon]|nr:histidine phosphatase family protein [Candidatus Aenigmarchaeota archaeon]
MKLFIIRHGQTDANVKGLMQGWLDYKLNENGVKQAKLLAKRLKKEKIDVFYSSDLKRAVMTAEEILKYHKKHLVKTSLLRELNFGELEGVTYEKYVEILRCYCLKKHEFRNPKGESYQDIKRRVNLFLRDVMRKHKNQNVAIIAHGITNRTIIAELLGIGPEKAAEIKQENTCINIIEISSKPKLLMLNDYSHLNNNAF